MLISHDIDVIRALSDKVAVMYGGTILEHGPAEVVLASGNAGRHPYTGALLASIPNQDQIEKKAYLRAIKGEVLDTINLPAGCRFYPRCDQIHEKIEERCRQMEPQLAQIAPGHKVRCWRYQI
jgi:oligopeptide/dipeptide ABC transporter ATP-binding protein